MSDTNAIIYWIITSLIGVLFAVVAYFLSRAIERLDTVEADASNNKLDLANFRTEVARDYAKEASVQHTVARVHDRMDAGFRELRDLIMQFVGKPK